MPKMTNLAKVQKAIEIQGYIVVNVAGRERQARSVKDLNGDWITDILTSDLCGHVRIRKSKAAVVAQAEDIIAREAEIRAEREAYDKRVAAAVMLS